MLASLLTREFFSGGPIALAGTDTVIGVTSFSAGAPDGSNICAEPDLPGGFTDLSFYIDFLEKSTLKCAIDSSARTFFFSVPTLVLISLISRFVA